MTARKERAQPPRERDLLDLRTHQYRSDAGVADAHARREVRRLIASVPRCRKCR